MPLLVKIAPDLADGDVDAIADLAVELGLDGIIATNTTIARPGLASDPAQVAAAGAGGLSGAPLRPRAWRCCAGCMRGPATGSSSSRPGESRPPTTPGNGSPRAPRSSRRTPASSTGARAGRGRVQDGLARRARAAGLTSISEARGTEAAPRTQTGQSS